MAKKRTPKMDPKSVVARVRRQGKATTVKGYSTAIVQVADLERLCELALAPRKETSQAVSGAASKLLAKGARGDAVVVMMMTFKNHARGVSYELTDITDDARSIFASALGQDLKRRRRSGGFDEQRKETQHDDHGTSIRRVDALLPRGS